LTSPGLVSATAFVVTSRPERYIKQLVSHFGNKVKTELTDEGGRLEFDFGVCELKAAPTGIELTVLPRMRRSSRHSRTWLPGTSYDLALMIN
jgi:hypothetical protein